MHGDNGRGREIGMPQLTARLVEHVARPQGDQFKMHRQAGHGLAGQTRQKMVLVVFLREMLIRNVS